MTYKYYREVNNVRYEMTPFFRWSDGVLEQKVYRESLDNSESIWLAVPGLPLPAACAHKIKFQKAEGEKMRCVECATIIIQCEHKNFEPKLELSGRYNDTLFCKDCGTYFTGDIGT